jgi:hypothetical protein
VDEQYAIPGMCPMAPSDADSVSISDSSSSFHDREYHIVMEARIVLAFLLGILSWPTIEFLVIMRRSWTRWLRQFEGYSFSRRSVQGN